LLEELRSKDPAEHSKLLSKLDELEVAQAREDYVAFCKYAMRDETSGARLNWAPYHDDYLRFIHETEAGVVFGHVEMGKTQLMIGYLIWRLGHNPNLRILFISATSTIANRVSSTIRAHIADNPRVRQVFPNLMPGTPWTDEEFCVVRREGITSPSLRTAGVGSSIISFRFDIVVGDDIVNNDNSQTAYSRNKVRQWFETSPMSRTSKNMKVIVTVNRWHKDDAAHTLARLAGWRSKVYPVGKKLPDGSLRSYWPGQWPISRIVKELAKRTPAEGDRALFCISYAESDSRVKQEWFVEALQRGKGLAGAGISNWVRNIELEDGWTGVVGVDLGLSDSERSDLTSIVFMAMRPPQGGFAVTDVEDAAAHGFVKGPEVKMLGFITGRFLTHVTLEAIAAAHRAFNKRPLIFVESVQAQRWAVDILARTDPSMQIFPFLTRGRGTRANKHHKVFGVEGLFAAFARNEITMLCDTDGTIHEDMRSFITECSAYSSDTHTGDRLMSAWIGYTGALAYMLEHQVGTVYTSDIQQRLRAQWEAQRALEEMTPEERCEHTRQQQYETNGAMIRDVFEAALREESDEYPTVGGQFLG
jgi:hypothetical protein